MKKITVLFERLRDQEDGVTLLEYALLAALIAMVVIVGAAALGTQVTETYEDIGESVAKAPTPKAAR